jgi:prolyl-tRNA synthetase
MGAYGIGVSRLVGALIEAHHDAKGIVWPTAVAPYRVLLTTARPDDQELSTAAERLYEKLIKDNDVLFDNRQERLGAKLADWELLGIPNLLLIGEKSLKDGFVEWKRRRDGATEMVPLEAIENLYAHF